MSGDIRTRIFVVGVPRSGTTLVQSLLAAHGELTSFTESHFFSRCFRPFPRLSGALLVRDPRPRLREFLEQNGVDRASDMAAEAGSRLRSSLPPRPLWPFASRAVARQFFGVLDDLTRQRGAGGWVEKTPRHLRFVPFLERVLTDGRPPRFIHVIRNGFETVASLNAASRIWERPYDLATCVDRWNADVRFSLGRVDCPHDRFVFYEDLTSRPEETVAELIGWLELTPQADIVERYGERTESLVTEAETWKSNVAGGVRRARTSPYALTDEQRQEIRSALRDDLYRRLREAVS